MAVRDSKVRARAAPVFPAEAFAPFLEAPEEAAREG